MDSSWNPHVPGKPRTVTVAQIHDGKTFQKQDGPSDATCCSSNAWKRALPGKWMNQYPSYFVQVNKLKVVEVDSGDGDECAEAGKKFYDRHVVVKSADDAGGPEFTVEFDRCWCAQNLIDCSVFPKANDIIDVQGFVTWDGPSIQIEAADRRPATASGWEIHPVSAWRVSK
jgi:hypothetical protein